MAIFNSQRIFNLTEGQKTILNSKFSVAGVNIMPHEISGLLSISNVEAIAILSALQVENLSDNYLIVYHNCEPDYAIEYIPFANGFPSLPWNCDNCQEEVEDINELSFGLMAILKSPVQFI